MIELLLQAESALSLGLLDRAETLYRQVAAADPRNSIAVVGLARVALERRREIEALELARRALAIDPENTAAQRMVQRLEEVLRHLGVELPPGPAVARRPGSLAKPVPTPKPPATRNPAPVPELESMPPAASELASAAEPARKPPAAPELVSVSAPEPPALADTVSTATAAARRRSLVDRLLGRE